MALNYLYNTLCDNSTRNTIIYKSQMDRKGSVDHNKKLILQWPRGRVHRIVEELIKKYRTTSTITGDLIRRNKDLENIKMSALAHPEEVFEQIFGLIQKYQYKRIRPTPDLLYAALLQCLPQYLLFPMMWNLDQMCDQNIPQYAIWERLEKLATDLHSTFAGKWAMNVTCYWCQEKGHKAFQCPRREAGHPKVYRKTRSRSNSNNRTDTDNCDSDTSEDSTMGYYKVPELSSAGEVNFEWWYMQFLAHASTNKYEEMVSDKPHPDLPPEGELTQRSDMSKAQKKALRKHYIALNDLYIALYNNNARNRIIEKSKLDRDGSDDHNAKLILQWPRGQVHRIVEELIKKYRRTNTGDKIQLYSVNNGVGRCGICGGRHAEQHCWEDEKNANRRPRKWKSKLNGRTRSTIDFVVCL
eukprot:jgi/Psemu1/303157/fgenesh1_kg.94_\